MHDRDQQMSLPLTSNCNGNGQDTITQPSLKSNVVDLSWRRTEIHEQTVLQRVIREGYVKAK